MQEYELNVLEQYDVEVSGTRKTRGAVLCDSDQGLLLLKEVKVSEKRIPALYELHEYLNEQGYTRTDRIIQTKEGEYLAASEDGCQYLLKSWFQGRECDIKKPAELLAASGNLAKLHVLMCRSLANSVVPGAHLGEEYLRHNRELKKVRKFMRGISPKGEFESAFLKYFEQMYQWADCAINELENSDYDKIYRESVEKGCMTHGEYNYHNILMLSAEHSHRREPYQIAVTNFEKFKRDVQVEDLYYFLRKVMEKQGWKVRLGDNMLNAYSAIRPLSREEMEYLKVRLIYPEKFWKVANSYYHSNKAWISAKSIEKLSMAIRQTEEKKRFLEDIFSFHL
ncbi:CotS family spore coat protein [Sporofaciens musculi]|jgi:spore coat protein, CotS family|uniref:CotS family spore coat protein n=1 Tax=Sporofaciens musculi TaxID=2681861 RepID=UPI00258DADC5|nr:CotS family spore coat protein [Sporofaciens musculi]